ncbi:response regulator [Vibrio parahaemolyticus]|uniref:response regulator n=1 Tax=Vibrio parahaemolyticus TaxID=670 RepID=UPI00111CF449|nr:response regulator [Vibrio parahaemolyticus]TOA16565.1 hybrid sensor histidine kinase/response regulator [Vibrio parahaemolyticus]TOI24180.1 hybrid sensor histidine kinase/response regulator [Vibrio parahaemolyticus]TOI82519.1 hybrid sensor histidine kinase/response regulator [Vibrio parahaemolyticus]TOI83116.1 hybrid sensor histidine kinase/response regulator [Vibrio parahaemolyticus]TOJ02044.1 hybrid sensor histidine kinase/response regulator [Vibrio parahaemolyticus]
MFKFYKKQKFKRLQSTLMTAFLVLSITPLTITAIFFLQSHSKDLQEQSTSHLLSVRDTKQQQILDYFEAQETEVMGFVRSELAYASGGRFYGLVNAFSRLGNDIEEARENAQQRYIEGSGDQIKTSILPESSNYVGSERYRLLHKRYHWAYLELLKRSDFNDILLVDINGNVTYSINKDDNYGTNLLTGRYKDSALGKTFKRLADDVNERRKVNEDYTPVIISDFELEHGRQVAWLGAPIVQQGYLHSYAMFRLPNNGITKLIADKNRESSINTLLVGSDQQPRTINTKQDSIQNSLEVIDKALAGQTDVGTYTNGLGEEIIAAFAPIQTRGITWALVVQLPEKEAFSRIHQLEKLFVIAMLIAIILVVIASHYLSNFITSPLLKLTWAAEKVSAGDLDETTFNTKRKDEIGRLAISFERMQRSIREKIQTIKQQNEELESNIKLIQKQNDELQLADKLKDEFLATTSHELRTPLHGMVGIAETLVSGANGVIPASQKYQLDIIIKSGQRLANLVDDLLDYHKMRYGSMDIQKSAVSLASATRLVLELSNHLLGNKTIRIINQVPADLKAVSADPQRLEQVLYNLIGNAIKYTSEGKIVISATIVDDHVRVQVVDTGQGIPAEHLEHIFEPLIQAGQDASRYRQGAGLGLSISRQLIELMGGSLYVSSQPMVGTTFSFTLPLASEEEIQATQTLVARGHFQIPEINLETGDDLSLPENPDGPLLYVADDEPVNLRVLESFLRLEGYRVRTVSDGPETLALVEQEKPELLLLDIMMPGMSGYQVCSELRETYDHAELPIIMLTALSQTEDRVRGFEAGANDYLSKPFNKQELAARIQAHLTASKAEMRHMENKVLESELRQRAVVEASLLETQGRLLEQLESAPEAIICLREDQRIRFANEAACKLFKRSLEQLKRSSADELIAPKYLTVKQPHYCGKIDIYIEDIRQNIEADILKLPEGSGLDVMYIFNVGGGANAARIHNLETAVEVLSSYAFDGDRDQLQKLKELGGEFTRLADKALGNKKDKQDLMREVLVDAMTHALDYWESVTGESKFAFAEQSGLWRVYLDRSTLQTRTLDKYMRIETLPKTPRWRTVLSSIEFILEHCKEQSPERAYIEAQRDKLQRLLTS